MPPPVPTLSICMIVKNEAHRLAEALTNFSSFADEIVIVDTGSTDETKAIALQHTDQVFDFPWCEDFSAARNVSISKAKGDYFLWLDADDFVDRENQAKIQALKSYFDGKKAFYFTVKGVDSSACSLYQLRCLPRRDDLHFQGRVHERIDHCARNAGLALGVTDIVIEHHGYRDPELVSQKVLRNLALMEKELSEGREDEQIQFYLAFSYDHLGMGDRAAKAMEKAITHMEKKGQCLSGEQQKHTDFSAFILEAFLFLARLYKKKGDVNSALRYLVKAHALAEKDEENAQTFFRLGLSYQGLHKHQQSLACFLKTLTGKDARGYFPLPAPPPNGKVLIYMAYSFICMKQTDKAEECMRKAWEQGVGRCESWEQLGLMAIQDGEMELSFQAYETARHTGELSADGYCNLGLLYDKQGAVQKAIDCYDAATKKEPGHRNAMANLAHLYMRIGQAPHAKLLFRNLVNSGCKDLDILLALAMIYVKIKESKGFDEIHSLLTATPGLANFAIPSAPECFYSRTANQLEHQKKTKLAGWAREIAHLLSQPQGSHNA